MLKLFDVADYEELEIEDIELALMNLFKNFELDTNILVFGELNLWNGKRIGYRELTSNLKDILSLLSNNFIVYLEDGDLKIDSFHHDGTNTYTVRCWKQVNLSDKYKQDVLECIYHSKEEIARNRFLKATKSLEKHFI